MFQTMVVEWLNEGTSVLYYMYIACLLESIVNWPCKQFYFVFLVMNFISDGHIIEQSLFL